MISQDSEAQVGTTFIYRLDSVEPTEAPAGSDGVWYRYKIVQGHNVITGMRPGTLDESNVALQQMVDRLNERATAQKAKQKK